MSRSLFTGKVFPDTVFTSHFDKAIVFEFDVIFQEIFTQKLKEFCQNNKIDMIEIESLDLQYRFLKKIDSSNIEIDYIDLLKKTNIEKELPQKLSYYILLSDFIIYSNSSKFGFYANRDFDVGILAYNNDINVLMFKDLIWGTPMSVIFNTLNYNEVNSKRVLKQFEAQEFFFL